MDRHDPHPLAGPFPAHDTAERALRRRRDGDAASARRGSEAAGGLVHR